MHSSIKSITSPTWRSPGFIFGGAALVFALGFGTAHLVRPDAGSSPAAVAVAKPAPSDAELLAKFRATDWNAQDLQGLEDLSAGLARSEPLRSEALKRFQQETQPTAKNNLRYLLTAQPLAEVAALGVRWAGQADSAATRADGFSLLVQQPPSAEVYKLALHAIEQEKDVKALAAAIWALQPLDSMLDPAQAQSLIPRLHALTEHPADDVRAASIQRLAQWDKRKQHIEQDVLRIINSSTNTDTLTAAVGATSIAGLNSDELKQAFFKLIESPTTAAELRDVVVWQMDRFLLSASEYESYKKIIADQSGQATPAKGASQ